MKHLAAFTTLLVLFFSAGTLSAQVSDRDQGIQLYRDGKFTEAIGILERSVGADKTDRAAWLYLAGAYVHTGDKAKAAQAFEKSRVRTTTPQPKYDSSVKITHKPAANYTEAARRKMQSGTIRVAVEFRADGTIGFAFPLRTDLTDLVEVAVEAAKGIRFEPAMDEGKPVTVINFAEYGFWIGRPPRTGTD
jgi:hypothetical protein